MRFVPLHDLYTANQGAQNQSETLSQKKKKKPNKDITSSVALEIDL